MPVAKEAVFEYFSFVIDLLANQEFLKANSRNIAPLVNALEKLHKALLELMRHPKLGKILKVFFCLTGRLHIWNVFLFSQAVLLHIFVTKM